MQPEWYQFWAMGTGPTAQLTWTKGLSLVQRRAVLFSR